MALNLGKQFEQIFKEDWKRSFPNSFLYRLPDQQSRYRGASQNPCDFIGFNDGVLYLLECKTHKGASIPFDAIPQYDRLVKYVGKPGIRVGIIVWLNEKDLVFYLPVQTLSQLKESGKKSVGLKTLAEGYNIKILPSVKKRVFMTTDYQELVDLIDGE